MEETRTYQNPAQFLESRNIPYKAESGGSELRINCPSCRHPNNKFYISAYGKGFYCFHCGLRGSLRGLVELFGGGSSVEVRTVEPPEPEPDLPPIDPQIVEDNHRRLVEGSACEDVRQYLYGRGFNDDTIKKFQLGWDGRNVTIPVFDGNGDCVNFRLRSDPTRPNSKHDLFSIPSRGRHRLFNEESLKTKPKQIIICEGEWDCILSTQLGYDSITSTGGAKSFRQEWIAYFKGIKKIYVCLDNDFNQEGQNGAIKTARLFQNEGISTYVVKLPDPQGTDDKIDITDYFVKLGKTKEDFAELLRQAKEYVETKQFQAERKGKVATTATDEELSEELKNKAQKIGESPTLLFDILCVIKQLGVVGEEENVLLEYIIGTSRITEEPLSTTLKAGSAAGKSFETSRVFKLFPIDAYLDLTDATAQSFYHAPKDYFSHKIIIIFEKHGQEKTDYSIRSLQSEKKLKLQITTKDKDTGQFITVVKEVDGPAGFITTTTEPRIHNENETRNVSIYVDESEEQTDRILQELNKQYLGVKSLSEEELEKWRAFQKTLKPYPVIIPFVEELCKGFPKKPIRVRRDYTKLLSFISVITILHQWQREKVDLNGKKYLKGSLADFYLAKVLLEKTLAKTIYELAPNSEKIIHKASDLNPPFTVSDLAKLLSWDYDTAKKWFDPAFNSGYFTLVEEHKGPKPAKYQLSGKEPESESILPSIESLYQIDPDWLVGNLYDPISGQTIVLDQELSGQTSEAETPGFEAKPTSTDAPMPTGANDNVDGVKEKQSISYPPHHHRDIGTTFSEADPNPAPSPDNKTFKTPSIKDITGGFIDD